MIWSLISLNFLSNLAVAIRSNTFSLLLGFSIKKMIKAAENLDLRSFLISIWLLIEMFLLDL